MNLHTILGFACISISVSLALPAIATDVSDLNAFKQQIQKLSSPDEGNQPATNTEASPAAEPAPSIPAVNAAQPTAEASPTAAEASPIVEQSSPVATTESTASTIASEGK